ncbi:MAG: RNA 2',3'-cyclic phosphodiesterase [Candidatus Omnitrophica bacterium]|nr:RNA 2',3'-cyclic phosphodiesterase [Candidatus Omnitrophota bacterium]
MIRAFIAVEIDPLNKKRLSELISCLKKSDTLVKWVNENQMHLTLKFLGNIEETKAQEVSRVLESITKDFKAFTISLSKIGAFPNINKPRVIWVAIDEGKDTLKLLADKIESGLEKIGFAKEKREFKAHLTLGRIKSLKNISQLTEIIQKTDFQSQGKIKISVLILFQSTLTSKGAIYAPLAEIKLPN